MDKKIGVLGCGWLGLPLAKALVHAGYSVSGSTTTPEKMQLLAQHQIQPFLIDLKKPEFLQPENAAFFEASTLAVNIPPKRNALIGYANQVKNLQKALLSSKVKQVIFVSSTSVYAPSFEPITEESPLEDETGSELILAEKIIASPENSWQTTLLRFAGLFGPGREPGRFLAGKTDLPDPEAPVNLIHLADCVELILQIIKQEKWPNVFNACADEHPSRHDFYRQAARKLGLLEPTFTAATAGAKPVKLITNAKIKAALNYRFKFPDPLLALNQPVENGIISG